MAAGGALYTMADAARRKGVSYHTVSRAVRRGTLPARRLGRVALIAAADLEAWAPMVERAPRKYRRSAPDPAAGLPLDPSALDRAALEARVVALAARLAAGMPDGELRDLADVLAALGEGPRAAGSGGGAPPEPA